MSRNIGEIVRVSRKKRGLTQGDLASRVGVTAAAICNLETGTRTSELTPEEMVKLSDALHDTSVLNQYCISCPLRTRISIRKFKPLTNIVPGVMQATLKNIQKMSETVDLLGKMMPKMLAPGFEQDPDFIDFRNEVLLRAIDVRRGIETLFDQVISQGFMTSVELKMLEDLQQRMCVEKGYLNAEDMEP